MIHRVKIAVEQLAAAKKLVTTYGTIALALGMDGVGDARSVANEIKNNDEIKPEDGARVLLKEWVKINKHGEVTKAIVPAVEIYAPDGGNRSRSEILIELGIATLDKNGKAIIDDGHIVIDPNELKKILSL